MDRVGVYAAATAQRLGFMGDRLVRMRVAAELHDVGKLDLHDAYRGGRRLDMHPVLGQRRLAGFDGDIADWVGSHHERLDGSGYPRGLGNLVGLEAQIIGAAEYYDVARNGSPWSSARSETSGEELLSLSDVAFRGDVVEALLTVAQLIHPAGVK